MDERQRVAPAAVPEPRGRLAPLVLFLERLSAPETRLALAWALLAAGLAWDLVILAAPLVSPAISWPVYLAGHFMCHQDPARSFWLDGRPLPLCARCTGLHLSAPLGMIALLALVWRARASSGAAIASDGLGDEAVTPADPPRDPVRWWRAALVVAALPTVLSVLIEWAGGPSSGASRCATALPLGAAGGAIMMAVLLGLDHGSHRARLLHLASRNGSSRIGPGGIGPGDGPARRTATDQR